ncbi:MAG: C-GCAxxG-C-C family protein [Chloroflexota bacterium]
MQVLQEALDLNGERVWTAASGFGGGVARHQSMCGALTGATMALGLYGGQTMADPKSVADTLRPRVQELLRGFGSAFGHTECRNLVPFDFSTTEGYEAFKASGVKQRQCNRYVRFTVEAVTRWKTEGSLPSSEK